MSFFSKVKKSLKKNIVPIAAAYATGGASAVVMGAAKKELSRKMQGGKVESFANPKKAPVRKATGLVKDSERNQGNDFFSGLMTGKNKVLLAIAGGLGLLLAVLVFIRKR